MLKIIESLVLELSNWLVHMLIFAAFLVAGAVVGLGSCAVACWALWETSGVVAEPLWLRVLFVLLALGVLVVGYRSLSEDGL